MHTFSTLPPGVRLDVWPEVPGAQAPEDAPEVAQLREVLRQSMPEVAAVLEMLAGLRPIVDLAGRLAGPAPAKLITQNR